MPKSETSHLLKGFQNGEFRRALYSFLQEKCSEDLQAGEDVPFEKGLKIIRGYIRKRQTVPECEVAPV
ncbi:MAG: hypothetical protein MUC63_07790 [Planctomycetes bacterium]|jgi:hypothetical protein|nr:hypothetical protein [Planctomycetota bacterium]